MSAWRGPDGRRLSCEQAQMAISARFDGELDVNGAQLDEHLAYCGDCAAWQCHVAQLASFVDRVLLEVPSLTERLLAAIRDDVLRKALFMRRTAASIGVLVTAWAAAGVLPGGSGSGWEAFVAIVVVVAAMQSSPAVARCAAVAASLGWLAVLGHGTTWTTTLRHLLMAGAAWASWRLARLLRSSRRLAPG